jgi:hypothetical protein
MSPKPRILAYEPPQRVLFSWDIGPTWQGIYFGADGDDGWPRCLARFAELFNE